MNTKQVIIMRKDLNMRKGKMVAQGSHASLGVILDQMERQQKMSSVSYDMRLPFNHPMQHWLDNSFTKICVYVNSEQELLDLYQKVKSDDIIPCILITDNGLIEFNGIPTITCAAIGPWISEEIDKYTSHLKLL